MFRFSFFFFLNFFFYCFYYCFLWFSILDVSFTSRFFLIFITPLNFSFQFEQILRLIFVVIVFLLSFFDLIYSVFFFFWLLYLRHAHITLIKLLLYLLFENLPLNFPVIFELSTVCLLPVVLTKRNGANFIFNFIFQVRFCLFAESIHLWIGFYCSTLYSFFLFFFFFRAGNAERLHLN